MGEELDEKVPWYTVVSEPEEPMEPVFGSITGTQLPPAGRRQNYIERRGWMQRKACPPWLNRPLIGTEVYVDNDTPWKKDRRPKLSSRKKRKELRADKDDDDISLDDMDAELDQLSGGDAE